MTPPALVARLGRLADAVRADPRWRQEDLAVSVLGMLLYGHALAEGRMLMLLEASEIDAAVARTLVERLGAAPAWSAGLVAEAAASAFDASHHPGQHALVAAGHSYLGVDDVAVLVDNVFANIDRLRRAGGA